jgi:hypothetical protein
MQVLNLNQAFTLIEPGPVVLLVTHDGGRDNVMTLSWTMVLDFTPRFAISTGPWNHSFRALQTQRECAGRARGRPARHRGRHRHLHGCRGGQVRPLRAHPGRRATCAPR